MTYADPFDVRRSRAASGLLAAFSESGVLAAADVHVARRLAALYGEPADGPVALAAALAVRAPRLGHVFVDLATIRDTATVDTDEPVDISELPWPTPDVWMADVTGSPLAVGDGPRPLRLDGSRLYLDRYLGEERQIADDLIALASGPAPPVDDAVLGEGVRRLFGDDVAGRQALAAAAAVTARVSVVAGGPGTGKTTTVARILALLHEQAAAAGAPPPLIGLAAPTGKAAARLQEAVHEEAAKLPVQPAVRDLLLALDAVTLHRLLGWRFDSETRFRHDRDNRLAYDVVVVDETSMVSLSLMARLIEAVRRDARLVLLGDPGQLTSIEAGAVLGDVVGPAADTLRMSKSTRSRLSGVVGHDVGAEDPPDGVVLGDGIVVLDRVRRYGGGIAAVAEAIRRGDGDATIAALEAGAKDVQWIAVDVGAPGDQATLNVVREGAVQAGRRVNEAARAGDGPAALEAQGRFRILCAHRRGDYGVSTWNTRVEGWLAAAVEGFDASTRWYVGRPLLVTANDHELRLYNGDAGVAVADGERVRVAFERRGGVLTVSPARLEAVETLYAMTIHKAQGSQVATAAVLLPPPESRILTRELLYTAVTRAQERLVVVGLETTIREAVARPVARASGLRERLWDKRR
ncbi:MAG: exodeoxyribonuclease V subunit alpha [Solirubrobacteraceae bacterium]